MSTALGMDGWKKRQRQPKESFGFFLHFHTQRRDETNLSPVFDSSPSEAGPELEFGLPMLI